MQGRIRRIFRNVGDHVDLIVFLNSTDPHIDMSFFYATGLTDYGDAQIMGLLLVSSVGFFLLSLGVFRVGEHLARKAGKIDMLTSY